MLTEYDSITFTNDQKEHLNICKIANTKDDEYAITVGSESFTLTANQVTEIIKALNLVCFGE